MQSIYFFRDADAELFPRVKAAGLEIPDTDPLLFDPVALTSNFRTTRPLVSELNEVFARSSRKTTAAASPSPPPTPPATASRLRPNPSSCTSTSLRKLS